MNLRRKNRNQTLPHPVPPPFVSQRMHKLSPSFPFETVWEIHQSQAASESSPRRVSNSKRKMVKAAVLLFGAIAAAGAAVMSPGVSASLKQIPFVEMLYEKAGQHTLLSELGMEDIWKKELSTTTSLSVTDQDIRFTVADVYYDGIQIVLSYQVEYLGRTDPITENDAGVYYQYRILGARPTLSGTHEFTITGDRTFVGTTIINVEPLPENPRLRFEVPRIGDIYGDWSVTVPLSLDKTSLQIHVVRPNLRSSYEGMDFTVEEIRFTPVSTQMVVKTEYTYPKEQTLWFNLLDDLDTLLPLSGGGVSGNGEVRENFSSLPNINPRPEFVTLVVGRSPKEIVARKTREVYGDFKDKFPLVLEGSRGGNVTVTGIDLLENKTILRYTASDANNQSPYLLLIDATNESHPSTKTFAIRTSRETFSFEAEYPPLGSTTGLRLLNIITETPEDQEKPLRLRIPIDWEASSLRQQ
ncbi:DUF4179 domain-containing protein [Paenibacillus mucilaginosus]|uniref:DUF4179 domain-containing protein n=1 Tax=Paenibacillus mucilaginosus (strain KNP414) TaxID=1036673 RepID=F8FK17_PAEMK|nr:DUF4179 domain-containing protein [Paenibacillus mucilaginosus]AEI44058.1 hypothetical protein KNP414_05534 [Paenibacillus mucilaginosus KNP414]WDM25506.1 DUF4179 domain-containing protein [Paenibacillus mucilaginosus]